MKRLRSVLQPLLLRRTKGAIRDAGGSADLELLPRKSQVLEVEMSAAERGFYKALFTRSKV